ncbi:hypothetical protein H6G89_00805 [Oscillatoria sp. FACHB-1407]|uniref:hypothetical protein n=1 Tax=Oscillatoria sp. FACHB-1407 TaxID=2692847 RepID=UPI0016866D54|nr:hypothetical protein [Oscillatoria sp. FACHB-1407]MBD2459569.1 hypothetical protein [Oscillatoria sp. FACHB-1407]
MSDPSLSDQAKNPDRPVVASEQAQPLTSQNVQGSAMLDAHAEVGGNQPEGEPVNAPIATNFSGATTTGDPKTAAASGEMGAFSTDASSAEKGSINLQNNPDIPGDRNDTPQADLPDTDQMKLPINAETNLRD